MAPKYASQTLHNPHFEDHGHYSTLIEFIFIPFVLFGERWLQTNLRAVWGKEAPRISIFMRLCELAGYFEFIKT